MPRDKMVLLSLDDMINNASKVGLSALPFVELKKEFERIMKERDELKATILDNQIKKIERRCFYYG